jgi:hypothetical protein
MLMMKMNDDDCDEDAEYCNKCFIASNHNGMATLAAQAGSRLKLNLLSGRSTN